MTDTTRTVLFWAGVVLLLVLSASGFQSVVEADAAATAGQKLATAAQLAYALVGLLAAGGLVTRRSWARAATWIWAALITLTAGLAPVVWGGSATITGLVAALGIAAVALLVISLTARRPPPTS